MTAPPKPAAPCHVCGAELVTWLPRYVKLRRVTSDCKPWAAGGHLGICGACGMAQSRVDERWRDEVDGIYRDYTVYHQGGGAEQQVFDQQSGGAASRSDRLLRHVQAAAALPGRGKLLDLGCGNGTFLRAVSRGMPGWTLSGSELYDTHRAAVLEIPGVEGYYTCGPTQVPGCFDVVSMIHVLEHIPAPRQFLDALQAKLVPGGRLLIQVPDHAQNPFDLLIADHCTHFAAETLMQLVHAAGYRVSRVSTEWVPKELSLLADAAEVPEAKAADPTALWRRAEAAVGWLEDVLDCASARLTSARAAGLFGTSIAATWLCAELGTRVGFFVDEDRSRQGRQHLGLPIYAPQQVPTGGEVFLALPRPLAEAVQRRLSRPGVRYHLPPAARA